MMLVGIVHLELRRGADELTPAAARGTPAPLIKPSSQEPASFAMAGIDSYREVLERPVFLQSRRPPPEERPGSVIQPSSLVLVGLIIAPNGRRALIQYGEPPRLQRIIVGQAIEGWSVESILPDRIVVRRGDAEEELKLKHKGPPRIPSHGAARAARN
jgi:hypothetical protein